jgi:hypothetical protein
MRETPEEARRARLLWTGAILLVIGLSLVLVVGEWFAMLDACVANPTCTAGVSADVLTSLLGLEVIAIGIAVVGSTLFMRGFQAPGAQD